jgi:AcrR family transcriptional regulator
MAAAVKRHYRSDLRATQARQTRAAVVNAAAELFVERGYGAATIDAIADAAGVSRKTVFLTVGGKLELLKTALNWAIAGDDQPNQLADRAVIREVLDSDDPAALISGWARVLVDIDVRVGPLLRALEAAAGTDSQAQALVEELQRQRLTGARAVVRRLTSLRALRAGLAREEATDIAWLATDPVLYHRLVDVRGWSKTRFEKWLATMLRTELMRW